MNGWDIVQVIVVLVGLLGGVMGPVLRLNSSMTKLNTTLNNVDERLKKQEEHSRESHIRIWQKNEEQDQKLENHEGRITRLEADRK